MRLTKGMLDSMSRALEEYLAGEGPMGGESNAEILKIMRDAERATEWIAQEEARRTRGIVATGKDGGT